MRNKELPIGFMDSGLGGLSVLIEAVREMPGEDFLYYGDSLNAPYGVKSQEEIKRLTYHVVSILLEKGIKGLAVACNTATGAAVRSLREDYPDLPIVGIEPAIKPAVEMNKGGRIIVLATPMTIAQEKYKKLVQRFKGDTDLVSVPCPGLMEFVEHGDLEGPELYDYFEEHLKRHLTSDTETIVLGCTHYPFIKPRLQEYLKGRDIEIIDGSLGTARELKRRLDEKDLLRTSGEAGKIVLMNSSESPEMYERGKLLLTNAGISLPLEWKVPEGRMRCPHA